MSFFIPLPSNSSQELFPQNTIGKYTVKLTTPIDLGNYEVALADIHYPHSWNNVNDARFAITIRNTTHMGSIIPGKYSSMNDLLQAITAQIENYHTNQSITVHWDKHSMLTTLTIREDIHFIKFSQSLCNIMGLEFKKYGKGLHRGSRHSDLDEGMTALYVYSNIVQPRRVGSADAQLLRIVPLSGKRSRPYQYTSMDNNLRYFPTIAMTTDLIEIDIRRDDGTLVTFGSGKVIVTLSFKKVR